MESSYTFIFPSPNNLGRWVCRKRDIALSAELSESNEECSIPSILTGKLQRWESWDTESSKHVRTESIYRYLPKSLLPYHFHEETNTPEPNHFLLLPIKSLCYSPAYYLPSHHALTPLYRCCGTAAPSSPGEDGSHTSRK